MDGPGDSLRLEREARGKTIEAVAEATGIHAHLLTALEQEDFDSLPGRGFGKLYIRAYAEVLGFDPRPVIESYDRAVRSREPDTPASAPDGGTRPVNAMLARWRQELIAKRAEADLSGEFEEETVDLPEEPEGEPGPGPFQPVPRTTDPAGDSVQDAPVLSRPVESGPPSRPARSRYWPMAWLLPLSLLPLVAYLVFFKSAPVPPSAAPRHEPPPGKAIAPPLSPPPPPEAEAPGTTPGPQTTVREGAAASSLEVTESGLGRRLAGTRLEGEGDRFRSGQRVTFATRVIGGGPGVSIHHVWLRNGRLEQIIRLRLGSGNWRTHSTKTLGRPGAWAVEARDERGRVLARADLEVAP